MPVAQSGFILVIQLYLCSVT